MERLHGHEQANAYIKRYDGKIILQSYSTDVLIYNVIDKTIEVTGLYSATTRKHIGWFMSQFIPGYNYYDIKDAFENNYILELKKEVMKW